MPRFEGKSVIVTGAGSGIGRATTRSFAREGARVLNTEMANDRVAETLDRIESEGAIAVPFVVDIGESGQMQNQTVKSPASLSSEMRA